MKKLLLSLFAAAMAVSAMAVTVELQPVKHIQRTSKFPSMTASVVEKPANLSRAESLSLDFSPAGAPQQILSLNQQVQGMTLYQAFQFTADNCATFAGNKITKFTCVTPTYNTRDENPVVQGTLFMTYDLKNGTPFYTQEFELSTVAQQWCDVVLDTPFVIADKPFYVGWYYTLPAPDVSSFYVDYMVHQTDEGGWVGVQMPGESAVEWLNITQEAGFLCLGVTIEGETLPSNIINVPAAQVQPAVEVGVPFDLLFMVENKGANRAETLEVELVVGNEEPNVAQLSFPNPLPYNQAALGQLQDIVCNTPGPNTLITLKVTKVNGVANNSTAPSVTVALDVLASGTGFKRNVVVEEFTGTWCGWCPRGIETMEYVRENMQGQVIPVAIHGGQDPMKSITYDNVTKNYAPGFPYAIINRAWPAENVSVEEIEDLYTLVSSIPAVANIDMNAAVRAEDKKVIIDATTSFCYDLEKADEKYALSFGITEDNVGPYTQTNYYNTDFQMQQFGQIVEELEGWSDLPYETEGVMYNDVARQLTGFRGLANSVPATVKAGEKYDFHYELKLNTSIKNLDKINVVGYLFNLETGMIENVAYMNSAQLAGVNDVVVEQENNAPVEYYNLQGVRVDNPSNGIFIRRQGSDVRKVAIK